MRNEETKGRKRGERTADRPQDDSTSESYVASRSQVYAKMTEAADQAGPADCTFSTRSVGWLVGWLYSAE